jgi:L-rhamnose mutarotase
MKIALHATLRPGAVGDYLREHVRVPDELRALFDRAGIQDWTIWRSGDRLFHLVECDDFEGAMRVIRADDADRRWQEHIGVYVDDFFGPDGETGYLPLAQVWRLEEQRTADHDLPIADLGLD